jgi:phosphoglycolate phosphatase-like HAD superfamily hydrolase
VRLLLFDLDGTVLRATRGAVPFNVAMRETFGVAPDGRGVRFDGKTDPLIIEELLARAEVPVRLDAATLRAFEERLACRLGEALADGTTRIDAIPGVRPVLEALAADGQFALAVLTGNLERTARLKLQAAGLDAFFAVGAFGSDRPLRAELPAVARARFRAHTGIDVALRDCVIVGDTPLDHAAAQANGIPCVLVASGRTPFADLFRLGPAAAFPDWSDGVAIRRALETL